MTKSAFDKIAKGLNEALAVARGEAEPARVITFMNIPVEPRLRRDDPADVIILPVARIER